MPMLPHCDRCNRLTESSLPTWWEDSPTKKIYRIRIVDHVNDDMMLCMECREIILRSYLEEVFPKPIKIVESDPPTPDPPTLSDAVEKWIDGQFPSGPVIPDDDPPF